MFRTRPLCPRNRITAVTPGANRTACHGKRGFRSDRFRSVRQERNAAIAAPSAQMRKCLIPNAPTQVPVLRLPPVPRTHAACAMIR